MIGKTTITRNAIGETEMWIEATATRWQGKREDLDGGRRPGGHARKDRILRDDRFLALRLCADYPEVRQRRSKRKRVRDRLMVQMTKHAVRISRVSVRVPHHPQRGCEQNREDRERDQREEDWLSVPHLSRNLPQILRIYSRCAKPKTGYPWSIVENDMGSV